MNSPARCNCSMRGSAAAPVGLVSGGVEPKPSSRCCPTSITSNARSAPYAELHKGTIDAGARQRHRRAHGRRYRAAQSRAEHERVQKFVEEGGVLIRFAGARLAANADDLVPVRLRDGERIWAAPWPGHAAASDAVSRQLALPRP